MIKQFFYVVVMCIIMLCRMFSEHEVPDNEIMETACFRIDDDIAAAQQIINETRTSYSTEKYSFEGYGNEYESCSEEVQILYDEMWSRIQNVEYFCYAIEDGYTYDDLDNVFMAWAAITADHPYVELYFMLREVLDETDSMTIAVESAYYIPYDFSSPTEDVEEIKWQLAVFDAECQLVVDGIDPEWSTYDKYRYLATLISLRTGYDYNFESGAQSSNGYAAINGGASICSGYSAAMQFLCEKADLYCTIVSGDCTGTSHAWNLVKLDSGTYYVDVTWSDETPEPGVGDWLEYFMFTEEKAQESRVNWDDIVATGTEFFPLH